METLQIVLLCLILLFMAIIVYRALYHKIVVQESTSRHKMLVAVRRKSATLDHYLKLSSEEKIELIRMLEKLMRLLHQRWLAEASYAGGFYGDVQGLPAGGEYDWKILAIYRVADYQHFLKCANILEEPQFEPLRYHLEIRFIFGTDFSILSEKIAKLF